MKQLLLLFCLFCLSANAQEKFTVYFDFDIAEANDASTQNLSKWIVNNPKAIIQKIYGYADKTGDPAYNQDLSERRAGYIYEQLKIANISLGGAEEKGFGESKSTANNNPKDRKVVIQYASPQIQPAVKQSELDMKVSKAKKGDRIRLDNMNFYENSTTLLPSSVPVLNDLLTVLRNRPSLKVEIQGHVCCQVENEERLSHRRAKLVYEYLVDKGIDDGRLSHNGFGSTRPVYPLPEKNEEERVVNRRVEIEIIEI
ncbi:OmpA family protein [Flavobacterium hauense]